MKKLLIIPFLILGSTFLSAQSVFESNLEDVISNETVTLSNYKSSKAVAIIFVSANCPYVKYYESRIQEMINDFANTGVAFLLVNSNSVESNDQMKAQSNKIDAPYLLDKSKELANKLGARKSPEAFLIRSDGSIYYKGAIDDNPQVATDVQQQLLKNAIEGLLKGESSSGSNNRPVGCMIK